VQDVVEMDTQKMNVQVRILTSTIYGGSTSSIYPRCAHLIAAAIAAKTGTLAGIVRNRPCPALTSRTAAGGLPRPEWLPMRKPNQPMRGEYDYPNRK